MLKRYFYKHVGNVFLFFSKIQISSDLIQSTNLLSFSPQALCVINVEETDDSVINVATAEDSLMNVATAEDSLMNVATAEDSVVNVADAEAVVEINLDDNSSSSEDLPFCRYCQDTDEQDDMIQPCKCDGSTGHVHKTCLQKWLDSDINSRQRTCEICMEPLKVRSLPQAHFSEQNYMVLIYI